MNSFKIYMIFMCLLKTGENIHLSLKFLLLTDPNCIIINKYCLSKKSCPKLYSRLLYIMSQDLLTYCMIFINKTWSCYRGRNKTRVETHYFFSHFFHLASLKLYGIKSHLSPFSAARCRLCTAQLRPDYRYSPCTVDYAVQ